MSKLGDYIKQQKEKDIQKFFGEIKHTSNKYFTFNRIINDDEIIIVTSNIKIIKDTPVLVVGNNKAVYLKDWLIREVRNYNLDIYDYAVKLNRKYWKVYTFKSDFEDIFIEKEATFDDLVEVAKEQNKKNMPIALRWGKM